MPEPSIDVPKVNVPVGLATQVGYALGLVQIIAATLIPIIDGIPDDASTASVMVALLLGATAVVTRVNDGRQKQAAAIYHDVPSPEQMDDFSGEDDDIDTLALGGAGPLPDAPTDGEPAERYEAKSPAKPGVDGPMPEGAVGGKPGPGKEGF